MKPRLSALLPLLTGLAAGAFAATPPAGTPDFPQTRARIDALFRLRNAPPATPDPRDNPFLAAADRPAAGPAVAGGAGADASARDATAGSADATLLKQAVATLKLSGAVQRNERLFVIVNQTAYKEGDLLTVRVKGEPVDLRVRHVTATSVTLALNETEVTLRFARPTK